MARVAVLVLNWNGARWLAPCFQALLAQGSTEPFEAWLVDNGSTDGSVGLVRERFPTVRVLDLPENLGFGRAYNQAVAATRAEYVAFLNNDTAVEPGWLDALVACLDQHPEAAAAGSKLVFQERPSRVNHAGGGITLFGAGYDIGFGAEDGSPFDVPRTVGCTTGAAMLVRRAVFLEVGGFDPSYFAYFEDVDLCWRLWLRGWTVRYEPRARVRHAYGGSTGRGRFAPLRIRHCQTNRLQNMAKHLEARTLAAILPASLAYDAVRVADLLARGHANGARAFLLGTLAFLRLLPHVLAERRRVQRTRRRTDAELRRLGALLGPRQTLTEWRRLNTVGRPVP